MPIDPDMMDSMYQNGHAPELDHLDGSTTGSAFLFLRKQLSDTTFVKRAIYTPNSRVIQELNSQREIESCNTTHVNNSSEFFFIHKHLVHDGQEQPPKDAHQLRISASCFQTLVDRLQIPLSFVLALSHHYLPNGRGSRKVQIQKTEAFDFWYILPIRVQVGASNSSTSTTSSSKVPEEARDPTQMNPFHKLDLPDIKLSIHRSCIGIFSRVLPDSKRTTFVAFDFMHGRWKKVALEPSQRIDQVMNLKKNARMGHGFGAFSHLVYLTSTTRWWTHALNSVNEQLVEYEARLQTELSGSHITPETVFGGINQALHSIAAHLHRYISELKSLQGIVMDLATHFDSLCADDGEDEGFNTLEQASRGFSQVSSQVEALHDFTRELEKKIENNLALLFNRIQINSNRRLVANGQDMQAILSAMQEDTIVGREMAKASHELAQEMKRDSVAMRTIAVVTMFFLPGATFAALFSMPFFSTNEWLAETSRFWVWIALTVPCTAGCFLFYYSVSRSRRKEDEAIELQTFSTS